jgi:peptidoglycan/LPS O-acetylase OafA/YrhL
LVLVGEWLRPGLFTDKIHPVSHPMSLSLSQWLGNITLTETWRHHLIGDQRFLFMGPTFTLCYEEQFYAVTGLLLLVTRRRFFVAAGVATILSVLFAALCSRRGIAINGFFFDGKWLLFAIGILVYYRLNYATGRQIWLAEGLLLLAIVYGFRQLHYDNSFLVAFGFAFLLARVHRWDEAWANSRIVRPFAFCGTLCYSLYLIHWPIAKALSHGLYLLGVQSAVGTLLITLPLCLAVSITVAWLFHLAVERRFMNTVPKSRDTARSKQSGVSPGVQVSQIRPAPASAAVAQSSGAAIEPGTQ